MKLVGLSRTFGLAVLLGCRADNDLAPPTNPHAIRIDFEEFRAGDLVTTLLNGTIGVWSNPKDRAMIFDSQNPSGNDTDLGSDNLGMILIISEDGDASDPDDKADGGLLGFDFSEPVYLDSVALKDSEETVFFRTFDTAKKKIGEVRDPKGGADGSFKTIPLNKADVSQLRVRFKGSGAIAFIDYVPQGKVDIEELIRVETPPSTEGLCSNGKPPELTFQYNPGSAIVTSQSKAEIMFDDIDSDDCHVRVIVTNKEESDLPPQGTVLFDGEVKCGEELLADGAFASRTYVHIYSLANSLLQSLQYHTSCSQPMALGDVIGSVRLVGYTDSNGNHVTLPVLGSIMDADADNPSEGPVARTGDTLVLTFVVTNPGRVPICQIQVDAVDSTRPDTYNPTPVLSSFNGFNVGDENTDNCLDTDETWLYTHSFVVLDDVGQGTGSSAVTGVDPRDNLVTDEDPVHFVHIFGGNVCDELCEKPSGFVFLYSPGTEVELHPSQAEKAKSTGTPDDDGASYVVVMSEKKSKSSKSSSSSKSNSKKGGKIRRQLEDGVEMISFFAGTIVPGTLIPAKASGDKFPSEISVLVFDNEEAFLNGDEPLQVNIYHTSCSKVIRFGDVIGSVQLVGIEDSKCGALDPSDL